VNIPCARSDRRRILFAIVPFLLPSSPASTSRNGGRGSATATYAGSCRGSSCAIIRDFRAFSLTPYIQGITSPVRYDQTESNVPPSRRCTHQHLRAGARHASSSAAPREVHEGLLAESAWLAPCRAGYRHARCGTNASGVGGGAKMSMPSGHDNALRHRPTTLWNKVGWRKCGWTKPEREMRARAQRYPHPAGGRPPTG
jgi:hypothetical protein